jgi:hypothetical protein
MLAIVGQLSKVGLNLGRFCVFLDVHIVHTIASEIGGIAGPG